MAKEQELMDWTGDRDRSRRTRCYPETALAYAGMWIGAGILCAATAYAQTSWLRMQVLEARRYPAMAYDVARQRTVLFGGYDASSYSLGDTWEWDGTSWIQRSPAASPAARVGPQMAYDAARQRTVLFGGWDGTA